MSLEAGRTLLHYRLVERLGEGGMGVVWKAVDTTTLASSQLWRRPGGGR